MKQGILAGILALFFLMFSVVGYTLETPEEELPERCRAEAEAAVKEDMVLWAIWRDAGLTLTEEELENCRQLWLQTYGYQSEDDMPASWEDESIARSLQRLAVERRVKALLLQSALPQVSQNLLLEFVSAVVAADGDHLTPAPLQRR